MQSVDSVGVPQIVETQIGNAQGGSNTLELAIHRVRNEVPPERVCEHQVVRVAPGGPGLELVPLLPHALPAQHGHDASTQSTLILDNWIKVFEFSSSV